MPLKRGNIAEYVCEPIFTDHVGPNRSDLRRCRVRRSVLTFSIVFTLALRMHQLPGYTLKRVFYSAPGTGRATVYPYTHLRPEAIRTTYTRSLPGGSVYFRNSIPSAATAKVHSRVAHIALRLHFSFSICRLLLKRARARTRRCR